MTIPSIMDVEVCGKTLVVRADLNVPVEAGKVTDATRITRFAGGMKPLLERGARLVIITHFGRPTPNVLDPAFSVNTLRPALSDALGVPVKFSDTCATNAAKVRADALANGEVLLCENLRYNPGETTNDPGFAAALAELGEFYVNDAFSCAHRAHASTDAIARLMPSYAGPLLMEELSMLGAALEDPERPSVALVGGAKVSTKIAVLKNLVAKVDHVIIGGGMANTFLFANGAPMGKSLHEADQIDTVREIQSLAQRANCALHLPEDVVAAKDFAAHARHDIVRNDACPADAMILDARPRALARFQSILAECRTILWNGPLGAFEIQPFDQSTMRLAQSAADLTRKGLAVSVAGGGDTVAALNVAGVADDFTYVSSAGGAFLEWLEGKTLPGIAALQDAAKAA
ncbi:MAG: phosphoglycerate kinase [Alphaproteobacteria bacterium]|nr:phosphoglycerate kinase [Alphaproteobacteria bacterium]MBU1280746.1 phosphoglycerate kinase [Alphaproteobacteria bacterium]MBU1575170.1 phosphoglycerate kinase [Alphaproteobacteria bacterium]MBU1829868.1 phosphoglycerate kinase [Alphaproteobacteria bacterium]MBU2076772.1 phosphoglycerate kinase [Alphaproteobacteria bacterium]